MFWAGISVKGSIPLRRIIGTMEMKFFYFVIIILKLKVLYVKSTTDILLQTRFNINFLFIMHSLAQKKSSCERLCFPTRKEKRGNKCSLWKEFVRNANSIIYPYGAATIEPRSRSYRATMGLP